MRRNYFGGRSEIPLHNEIFFDAEFTGLHQGTTLISLGMVARDGRTFYAEFTDYDQAQIDDWLKENVIANLRFENECYLSKHSFRETEGYSVAMSGGAPLITSALSAWLNQFDPMIEMWSDCLAYDWVLFCELFGGGPECLPGNVLYIPFDICTLFKIRGIDPDISRREFSGLGKTKHNAMDDALMIKACYERLQNAIHA